MNHFIDIQHATTTPIPISDETIINWVRLALPSTQQNAELTLRLVDPHEMITLNHTYRKQNKPTNVLAFPFDLPKGVTLDNPFLGDVVICPAVLADEHLALHIPLVAHWAHIVVHGVLHLLGFDHQGIEDTRDMQALEINALKSLGFPNPYTIIEDESGEQET